MRLEIDPGLLDRVAANLRDIAGNLDTQVGRYKEISSDVESAWQSDYTSLYIEQIGIVQNKVDHSADSLREAANALNHIAERVRILERELAEKARASGGGGNGAFGGGGIGSR